MKLGSDHQQINVLRCSYRYVRVQPADMREQLVNFFCFENCGIVSTRLSTVTASSFCQLLPAAAAAAAAVIVLVISIPLRCTAETWKGRFTSGKFSGFPRISRKQISGSGFGNYL